jgi:tryptophan synthase alpha chain
MSSLDTLFANLRANKKKAFLPFVTAGDPDMETTSAIIKSLAACGASACEVGVPYSDPIADGPVIQASYQRALDGGFKLTQLFDLGKQLTPSLPIPLVTMVSYSIIHRTGMQRYVDAAIAAGYCGAIVPDLLVEEAKPLADICRKADFSLVQLVTPTTPRDRQVRIAELSSGFLYFVSVTGITGERSTLAEGLLENVGWLRQQTELPICIGFGVSSAETAKTLAPVADGVIVGSAIVKRIAAAKDRATAVADVTSFAKEIVAAIA